MDVLSSCVRRLCDRVTLLENAVNGVTIRRVPVLFVTPFFASFLSLCLLASPSPPLSVFSLSACWPSSSAAPFLPPVQTHTLLTAREYRDVWQQAQQFVQKRVDNVWRADLSLAQDTHRES